MQFEFRRRLIPPTRKPTGLRQWATCQHYLDDLLLLVPGLMVVLVLGGDLMELSFRAGSGHGAECESRSNNGNNEFLDHFDTSFQV